MRKFIVLNKTLYSLEEAEYFRLLYQLSTTQTCTFGDYQMISHGILPDLSTMNQAQAKELLDNEVSLNRH